MNFLLNKSYGEIMDLNKSLIDDGSLRMDSAGLSKAFEAGEGSGSDMTDLDTLTGGRAITVENIDTALKTTAEQQKNLVFYNLIRNRPIYAVLDQYMVLSDHGINAKRHVFGKFRTESAFPATSDVTLSRKVDSTKFIRDMRDLTHVAEQVSTMAEKHRIINNAGAITVLEACELATMFGNSDAMPTQFDGFFKKLKDAYDDGYDSIVDCRLTGASSMSKGGELDEALLDAGAEKIMNSYGAATHLVMPTKVKSDLNLILPVSRRVMLPGAQADAQKALLLGIPASGFYSDFAHSPGGGADPHFMFVPSIDTFFPSGESDAVKAPSADFPSASVAPAQPTGVLAAAASLTSSKFIAGDAGDYWYKVSAYNADGISISVAIDAVASVTVAAGEKVTLTITCNDADITGLSIFRSALDAADSSDCRWIADIAVTNAVSDTLFIDYNLILPGTSQAVLLSNAPETDAMDYRQLMPFVRMELPFGLNSIVGYPYLYMLYTYLRLAKLKNDRTMGSYHQLYTNIRWTQSTF